MQTFPDVRFQEVPFVAPGRILVATDLTDDDYLVPHAVAQARASNARVTLLHAILPARSISVEAGRSLARTSYRSIAMCVQF